MLNKSNHRCLAAQMVILISSIFSLSGCDSEYGSQGVKSDFDKFSVDKKFSIVDIGYAGDMNNDSYGDIFVKAYESEEQTNHLLLISGKTKETIAEVTELTEVCPEVPFNERTFADFFAAGDLNFDGYDDVIIQGAILYGGADSEHGLFGTDSGTFDVSSTDISDFDLDSDGIPDSVFSCVEFPEDEDIADLTDATTNEVRSVNANGEGSFKIMTNLGINQVAKMIGDVNGDGKSDVAVLITESKELGNTKKLKVFTSSTEVLYEFEVKAGMEDIKFSPVLIATKDINGDGIRDFYISDRYLKTFDSETKSKSRAYSGSDGTLLFEIESKEGEIFGQSAIATWDYNGDDTADIMIPVNFSRSIEDQVGNSVEVFSGKDGAFLDMFYFTKEVLLGVKSGFGDMNADGFGDMILLNGENYFTVIYGSNEVPYAKGL